MGLQDWPKVFIQAWWWAYLPIEPFCWPWEGDLFKYESELLKTPIIITLENMWTFLGLLKFVIRT